MNFQLQIAITIPVNNCDSQSYFHRQKIYSPQWFILSVLMHVMYNIMVTAIDVASKFLTFLKANYLKYQVMKELINLVINTSFQVSD